METENKQILKNTKRGKPKSLEDDELIAKIDELTLEKKKLITEIKLLKNRLNARIWKAKHLKTAEEL